MKKHFTLIEIALALGVTFLAVTVLIAFFPTSFKRIENAQSNSYVVSASQQMISHLKNSLSSSPRPPKLYDTAGAYNKDYKDYLTKWANNVNAGNNTLATNPLPISKNTTTVDYFTYPTIPNLATEEGTRIDQATDIKSVYLIRSSTFINGVINIDQAIEARIWKSPLVHSNRLQSGFDTDDTKSDVMNYYSTDYSNQTHVNIEFSWPVTTPYAERSQKYYAFVDLVKWKKYITSQWSNSWSPWRS